MTCSKKPSNCNCYKNPGSPKKDGSHDHRHNVGSDRTPAQKEGDAKRRKDQPESCRIILRRFLKMHCFREKADLYQLLLTKFAIFRTRPNYTKDLALCELLAPLNEACKKVSRLFLPLLAIA